MKKNKTVLIIGANSIVAQEISIEFSKNGYNLILALRDHDRLNSFSLKLNKIYKNKVFLKEFDILDDNYFLNFLENLPLVPNVIISTIAIMDQPKKSINYSIDEIINTNYLKQVIFLNFCVNYLKKNNRKLL